ncbi:hypothetical protein GCM10010913_34980 [Paenibacillus aceti]|uniref:Uncharacterized protein n=1 Tax=Paenibacillus aceti TaxID=1820010 RepID=A0ABQ1W1L2_9BACL|nr:hypothetical protein GCM10010913_34980 [Paenibacillus aceti]
MGILVTEKSHIFRPPYIVPPSRSRYHEIDVTTDRFYEMPLSAFRIPVPVLSALVTPCKQQYDDPSMFIQNKRSLKKESEELYSWLPD